MMDVGIVLSVVSLVVAIISAAVAYISVYEQRRLTTNVTSYQHLAETEMLLSRHPELLMLHGIDLARLAELNLTPIELVYLAQSFSASDIYHRLGGEETVRLTQYRTNLLANKKVQDAWLHFIRGRFVSHGAFSVAIDRHLAATSAEGNLERN